MYKLPWNFCFCIFQGIPLVLVKQKFTLELQKTVNLPRGWPDSPRGLIPWGRSPSLLAAKWNHLQKQVHLNSAEALQRWQSLSLETVDWSKPLHSLSWAAGSMDGSTLKFPDSQSTFRLWSESLLCRMCLPKPAILKWEWRQRMPWNSWKTPWQEEGAPEQGWEINCGGKDSFRIFSWRLWEDFPHISSLLLSLYLNFCQLKELLSKYPECLKRVNCSLLTDKINIGKEVKQGCVLASLFNQYFKNIVECLSDTCFAPPSLSQQKNSVFLYASDMDLISQIKRPEKIAAN